MRRVGCSGARAVFLGGASRRYPVLLMDVLVDFPYRVEFFGQIGLFFRWCDVQAPRPPPPTSADASESPPRRHIPSVGRLARRHVGGGLVSCVARFWRPPRHALRRNRSSASKYMFETPSTTGRIRSFHFWHAPRRYVMLAGFARRAASRRIGSTLGLP